MKINHVLNAVVLAMMVSVTAQASQFWDRGGSSSEVPADYYSDPMHGRVNQKRDRLPPTPATEEPIDPIVTIQPVGTPIVFGLVQPVPSELNTTDPISLPCSDEAFMTSHSRAAQIGVGILSNCPKAE